MSDMEFDTAWYNFDTGEYDYREAPATLEEAMPYVPNTNPAARSLFSLLVEHKGMSVAEAMVEVLCQVVGHNPCVCSKSKEKVAS